MSSELEQLRQESEQLKNQIRVSDELCLCKSCLIQTCVALVCKGEYIQYSEAGLCGVL